MSPTLKALPANWGSRNQVEKLTPAAAASLSRVMMRAVAETGSIFNLNDGYRSYAEQVALFKANYRNRGTRSKVESSDRMFGGTAWRHVTNVAVASPDLYGTGTGANHTKGLAIDIVPAAIQGYLQSKGLASGWSWAEGKRNGEPWHFVYIASRDQYRGEGFLDHAAVQKVVGAKVDGKIGPATVAKIKAWQKKHGLDVDGKVGPATKKAMGLSGKGDAAPAPSIPTTPGGGTSVPATGDTYTLERHQTKNLRPGRVDEKRGLTGKLNAITLHHWGSDGQSFDNVVSWLVADGNGNNQSSAHEVIEGGRVAVLASIEDGTWNSGSAQGNVDNYALECRPEADEATVYTVAARVAAVREEAGWDVPLNLHQDYVATECPGRYVALKDTIDKLARGEDTPVPVTPATPSTPTTGGNLPTGKALLVKLTDCPDFPLLRTPDHLCYYGGDSKQTAVSGKMPNSLVPGEITGTGKSSGAEGLRVWQKRMNERGYSLDVDGRYGDGTEKAAKNLQRLAGLTQDGDIGPDTWYAAWLLPVVS